VEAALEALMELVVQAEVELEIEQVQAMQDQQTLAVAVVDQVRKAVLAVLELL
tara:strand:+ start:641 stop:799 length:159 start_codon:yes stop_codon:yes gene_type:complete